MPSTMNVNYMTVVHKKSTGIAASFPDVCKTPTPGGPVPIPYPNIAMSSNAAKTTKKVKVDKEGVMVKGSNFSMSTGDEAGNAGGGVISSKFKGKAEFMNYSFDVKFEGKAVARLADPMGNNMGSPMNVPCPAEGQSPLVVTDAQKAEQKEACKRAGKNPVDKNDKRKLEEEYGMPVEHAKAISDTCKKNKSSVTVRSTNADCVDKIRAGYPAKGCDIKEKTISAKSLAKSPGDVAEHCEKHNLNGFVGHYDDSGKLLGVKTTDGFAKLSDVPPVPKNSYTGDYDLHDMFGKGGERIKGESKTDKKLRRKLNQAIGRGPVGKNNNMIRHGAQSDYSKYVDKKNAAIEKANKKIDKYNEKASEYNSKNPNKKQKMLKDQMKPITKVESLTQPDPPLLAFDENGNIYELKTKQDVCDYYKCKGQEPNPEWGCGKQ